MLQTIPYLKTRFKTGDKPTQQDFADVFDSYRHKSDNVPMSEVNGLTDALGGCATSEDLQNYLNLNSTATQNVSGDVNFYGSLFFNNYSSFYSDINEFDFYLYNQNVSFYANYLNFDCFGGNSPSHWNLDVNYDGDFTQNSGLFELSGNRFICNSEARFYNNTQFEGGLYVIGGNFNCDADAYFNSNANFYSSASFGSDVYFNSSTYFCSEAYFYNYANFSGDTIDFSGSNIGFGGSSVYFSCNDVDFYANTRFGGNYEEHHSNHILLSEDTYLEVQSGYIYIGDGDFKMSFGWTPSGDRKITMTDAMRDAWLAALGL